jgi:hypothetical protein
MNRFNILIPVTLLFVGCGTSEIMSMAGGAKHKECRAEVPSNVKAIKEAQIIYDSENDAFVNVTAHPSANPPGKVEQAWAGGNDGFNALGWMPDGKVRGVYSVSTTVRDFEVTGRSDCDGDGVEAIYTATKSINVTLKTPNDAY